LIVNAKISDTAPANASLRNLAFISPAAGETAETNILAEPSFATSDTNGTTTNNDSQATLSLGVAGAPDTGFGSRSKGILAPIAIMFIGGLALMQPRFKLFRK
jgi:hypothetical protein